MKVRMLQCLRGPAFALDPGDIHEGDSKSLVRWCEKGIAEPVVEVRETPEAPAKTKRKPSKRKAVLE